MRTHLSLLLATVLLASPAAAASRNFGITGFDRLRVDGPFRVRLGTGIAPFASASGDSAALDRVDIRVEGRTLIVRSNQSAWGGYSGQSTGPVEINLGTHELTAAGLNGSGSLAIDKVRALTFDLSVQGSGAAAIAKADVDQFRIAVGGTASAKVAGRAGKLSVVVRGMASLDSAGLAAKDATIAAEGPATVAANVSNAADISGSGVATVTLTGSPACITRLAGSASVSGCRSTQ